MLAILMVETVNYLKLPSIPTCHHLEMEVMEKNKFQTKMPRLVSKSASQNFFNNGKMIEWKNKENFEILQGGTASFE